MTFKDNYTTADLKAKDFDNEKDKVVLSNDAYAQCELQELLINMLRNK